MLTTRTIVFSITTIILMLVVICLVPFQQKFQQTRYVGLYGGPDDSYLFSDSAFRLWNVYVLTDYSNANDSQIELLAQHNVKVILDLCLFDYPANRSGINYEIINEYFSRLQNIKDKIWAITLYEENPQSSIPLLQQMYDYIKEKWGGFRLYQFMGTEVPFSQYETLSADGYVVDPYALTQTDFEHYMDPIINSGKQVIDIIYMAMENGYYYGDGHTWIEQIPYCYKNNIWTVIYAYYYGGLFQLRGNIPDLINRGYGGELQHKWNDILKARTCLLTGHVE